jgi:tetratricopeptide (TPR) repeat protein
MNTGPFKMTHYAKTVFFCGFFVLGSLLYFSCSSVPAGKPEPLEFSPPPPQVEAPELEGPPPTDTQGILTRISVLLSRGDYDGALALFDTLSEEERETSGIRLIKASVLNSAGRFQDARTITNEVIAAEPDNMEALFVLSMIEGASGKDAEQKKILERIVKAEPEHVRALTALGEISFRARSLRTAASYFDRALAAEPANGNALVGRAGVYRYDHNPKTAEQFLNRAIKLYPQWARPLSERARLYKGEGYLPQALADLDAAKKLDARDYWISIDRGIILVDLNRKEEALTEFTRAIELNPQAFLAYVYSAGIKDETGDLEGAERDYEILTKLRPDYYFAFEGLGILKMRKGLWAEARDSFVQAYNKAPSEASYALLASICWIRAERINSPRQFLEQALRNVKRDTLDWYLLRVYHDLAGDNDAAARIDKETNPMIKAKMLYYLATYYDLRGSVNLANRFYTRVWEMDMQMILEWRLNEWIVEERGLKVAVNE